MALGRLTSVACSGNIPDRHVNKEQWSLFEGKTVYPTFILLFYNSVLLQFF